MKTLKVFLTGATGTMGSAVLELLAARPERYAVTCLVRNPKSIEKTPYRNGGVSFIFGNLLKAADIERGVRDADIVLHIGGMVSPKADWYPDLTWRVNTGSMQAVVDAVKRRPDAERVGVVYIGSVAQYGFREEPYHWGRTGDPLRPVDYDAYSLSKIEAERILAESGLKRWVSLRQTGILCPQLLMKGADPITFHVPLRGVLEWTTREDSGRLVAALCDRFDDLPDSFWRRFYNVGSGASYRLDNYDFECRLMKALGCPPPEKVFEPSWFATRNFHGMWFADSDRLEELFHFRSGKSVDEYFSYMASNTPAYFRLARFVPAALIKAAMKTVARKPPLGTLSWTRGRDPGRTRAFFGSQAERDAIPGWDGLDLSRPSDTPRLLDHGYDESKPESEWTLADMEGAARFRGGRCLSRDMAKGDIYTPLLWEDAEGRRFSLTPASVLLGGHWTPVAFGRQEAT